MNRIIYDSYLTGMQKGVIKKEDCYKRYRLNPNDKDMLANFQAQNEWVRRNTISSTPTSFDKLVIIAGRI